MPHNFKMSYTVSIYDDSFGLKCVTNYIECDKIKIEFTMDGLNYNLIDYCYVNNDSERVSDSFECTGEIFKSEVYYSLSKS